MPETNKYAETESLNYFLSARESATGEKLSFGRLCERPDFLCRRPNGSLVGVELTRVGYRHDSHVWSIATGKERWIDNCDLFACIFTAVEIKARKLREHDWKNRNETFLVLELVGVSRQFEWPDTSEFPGYFGESGFTEIWLSDHASIEAFGAITLFGIFPTDIWGRRGQHYLDGKPFG